jgi:hypothetical protein
VLGHLAGKGVFEEPTPGRFALNQAALALREAVGRAAGLEVVAAEQRPSGRFVVECRPT